MQWCLRCPAAGQRSTPLTFGTIEDEPKYTATDNGARSMDTFQLRRNVFGGKVRDTYFIQHCRNDNPHLARRRSNGPHYLNPGHYRLYQNVGYRPRRKDSHPITRPVPRNCRFPDYCHEELSWFWRTMKDLPNKGLVWYVAPRRVHAPQP